MPTGERAPEGVLDVVVEYLADVYTEAIKPMYWIVIGLLIAVCTIRLVMRVRHQRRHGPRPGTVAAGPDPPGQTSVPAS